MMTDPSHPLFGVWYYAWMVLPTLMPLAPGVGLALWASSLGRRVADDGADRTADGGEVARAILEAAGVGDVAIVAASGPLADFYDPWRRELRLSPGVLGGRSARALAFAAHMAGHALQGVARPRLVRAATLARLALDLWVGSAWIVVGSGLLLRNPFLCQKGGTLELVGVAALMALHLLERDANRRVLAQGPATNPIASDPQVIRALEALSWADIAATLPLPRRPWPWGRHH